jgi:hypothetical protein
MSDEFFKFFKDPPPWQAPIIEEISRLISNESKVLINWPQSRKHFYELILSDHDYHNYYMQRYATTFARNLITATIDDQPLNLDHIFIPNPEQLHKKIYESLKRKVGI